MINSAGIPKAAIADDILSFGSHFFFLAYIDRYITIFVKKEERRNETIEIVDRYDR